MSTQPPRDEFKGPAYEIFIALLTALSLINLVLLYVVNDSNIDDVLRVMNAILSIIFFIDFLTRLFTAGSKRRYLFNQYGWADLLASLPFPQLKVFRLIRLVRAIRNLRTRGLTRIGRLLLKDRAESALLTLLLMGVLVLEFGSLQMLRIEQYADGANIVTASDALWFTLVTISTVGYGDRFPVTSGGRIMGGIIIVIGVCIFGTFTGYLANLFLAPSQERRSEQTD